MPGKTAARGQLWYQRELFCRAYFKKDMGNTRVPGTTITMRDLKTYSLKKDCKNWEYLFMEENKKM